jgi:O-antigen ligase
VVGFVKSIPVAAIVAAMGFVVVLAQSRSGLIAFLVVVGAYFVRRAGAWGIVAGCLVGPPMLLFGGRAGSEAEQSSSERVELLREAFDMIRGTKGIGIGLGQFSDESSIGLTAHNAYVLAAAETGLVGMCLFGLVVYSSIKVPIAIWFGDYEVDATVSRMAAAVALALGGAVVGIFFLSWAYKDILYLTFASSAALYGVARAQDPRVRVRISFKEVALVCLAMAVVLAALYVAARVRGT